VSVLAVSAEGEGIPMLLNLNPDNVMSSAISETECDIRTLGSGDIGLYLARSEKETLAVSSLSNIGGDRECGSILPKDGTGGIGFSMGMSRRVRAAVTTAT